MKKFGQLFVVCMALVVSVVLCSAEVNKFSAEIKQIPLETTDAELETLLSKASELYRETKTMVLLLNLGNTLMRADFADFKKQIVSKKLYSKFDDVWLMESRSNEIEKSLDAIEREISEAEKKISQKQTPSQSDVKTMYEEFKRARGLFKENHLARLQLIDTLK